MLSMIKANRCHDSMSPVASLASWVDEYGTGSRPGKAAARIGGSSDRVLFETLNYDD